MLDALWPAAEALASAVETGQNRALALATAVRAAKEGAQATRHIVARRERSSYLGDRALGHPDPGAVALGVGWKLAGTDGGIGMTSRSRILELRFRGQRAMLSLT
jgi:dihydroxyacetone kinase